MILELTDANFKTEISKSPLAVVKFWQDNCQPCNKMEPVYKEVATKFPDISFFEINRKNGGVTGEELRVNSSPTFIVFKNGKEVWRDAKTAPVNWLVRKIEEAKTKEPVPAMTLERAYQIKGQCITEIEIANSRLEAANRFIAENLN